MKATKNRITLGYLPAGLDLNSIEIEHGVPIPPPRQKPSRKYMELMGRMEVGDSFVIPCTSMKGSDKIRGLFGSPAKRQGIKITTRSTSDGIRIWRIK